MKQFRVGIFGASGLLGIQLVSMLHDHPAVSELVPFSRRAKGMPFGGVVPAYHHLKKLVFADPEDATRRPCDVYFFALSHGESFPLVRKVAESGAAVIDLSADFRLEDPAEYERIYGVPHGAPELLPKFVRVVPELNGELLGEGTKLVSVPGCTATGLIVGLHPLLKAKAIRETTLIADAKTSSSGAGSKSEGEAQAHVFRGQGVRAHKLLGEHRHRHEVAAFLERTTGVRPKVLLNTFAVDMQRGYSLAIYADCADGIDQKGLHRIYREAYGSTTFVRVLRLNAGYERLPNPKLVARTNYCDVGFSFDDETKKAVILVALDNLLKGGSGQGVQCFNRLVGADESEGLPVRGHFP